MSDEGELIEGEEGDAPRGKQQRALEGLAMRELRRAHKLYGKGGPAAEEANFLVASANVLATLELASAVRDSTRGPND